MRRRIVLCAMAAVGLFVCATVADEDEWLRPLGPPPKAKPRRISGGESFPPLPLPATPLRRSERKRSPSPPKLIGKVVWGETATFTYENGFSTRVSDWNLCPSDVQSLLARVRGDLGLAYSSEAVSLADFHGDPERTPVLFFSGGRTIRLGDAQTAALRAYVERGGLLVFDSIAGSPYFHASAREAALRILPDRALRIVPLDHPIFHTAYSVTEVDFPRNLDADRPRFEAVYVGSRIGVLVSPYGLGCGWDGREVPLIDKAVYYDVGSAVKLGINIVAYAVGYAGVGREEAEPELFGALDEGAPTDEFVFAQIRHGGAWNPHPGAAAALLRRLRRDTAMRVSLKRVAVSLASDDLAPFTFLYLTGLDDFAFEETEVRALRSFLAGGGTLLVNNALGLTAFDVAARRELARVLPDATLQPVPLDHPLFAAPLPAHEARYTPAVVKAEPDLAAPVLEGVVVDGALRVIYSGYDLEAGWSGLEFPLAKAYETHSAMRLGVNIAVYASTR